MGIKHAFTSAVTDDLVAGEIGPNDWNDDHILIDDGGFIYTQGCGLNAPLSGNATIVYWGLSSVASNAYIYDVDGLTQISGTNNGSNYWTIALKNWTDDATISSFNTSADAANAIVGHKLTISANTAEQGVYLTAAKTGSPGLLYPLLTLRYRLLT